MDAPSRFSAVTSVLFINMCFACTQDLSIYWVFPSPLDICATPLAVLLVRLMETVLAHSNSQILYHSVLGCLFRALSPRSHMEFKSFSEAKRCDSLWDSPLALSLHLRLSPFSLFLSYLFFLTLFPPALQLYSRVMGRRLSGKPISFSMFSHFYPITACSEVSEATWHFYWGLIKDLWFNPCNLIEISHNCEALALCGG